jgi:hypothetical protein
MENYLNILEESLRKKSAVLDRIQKSNEDLVSGLSQEGQDVTIFDAYLEQKEALVGELNALDDGFESLYHRVEETLKDNREQYATQIRTLQQLTREVTDKTVQVQAAEARAKRKVDEYFLKLRKEIRDGRNSNRAAMSYFQAQSGAGVLSSQFMDDKK